MALPAELADMSAVWDESGSDQQTMQFQIHSWLPNSWVSAMGELLEETQERFSVVIRVYEGRDCPDGRLDFRGLLLHVYRAHMEVMREYRYSLHHWDTPLGPDVCLC